MWGGNLHNCKEQEGKTEVEIKGRKWVVCVGLGLFYKLFLGGDVFWTLFSHHRNS